MSDDGEHLGLPRGFQDVDHDRMQLILRLRGRWTDVSALFGYRAVEVPPVGFASTFVTGHNAAGGRNYEFPDRRGRRLALVSDSLPAVLRLGAGLAAPESRLSYCVPIFRYVRRPRRYFHHLGLMDIYRRNDRPLWGEQSMLRLVRVVVAFLADEIPLRVTVTSPGLWHSISTSCSPTAASGMLINELRGLDPCQRSALLAARGAPPEITELADLFATSPGLESLPGGHRAPAAIRDAVVASHAFAAAVKAIGVDVVVDLGLLHATEFHDTTAFLLHTAPDRQLLGDGGSYGLFGRAFLSQDVGVHAAVLGLERLADIIGRQHPPMAPAADFAVLAYPGALGDANTLCDRLRMAGVRVWDQIVGQPIRRHLREFADLGVPASTIIGDRERESRRLTVRRLDGSLVAVASDDLVAWLTVDAASRDDTAHSGASRLTNDRSHQ